MNEVFHMQRFTCNDSHATIHMQRFTCNDSHATIHMQRFTCNALYIGRIYRNARMFRIYQTFENCAYVYTRIRASAEPRARTYKHHHRCAYTVLSVRKCVQLFIGFFSDFGINCITFEITPTTARHVTTLAGR